MARSPHDSVSRYARDLVLMLREAGIEVPPSFKGAFIREAKRVGESNHEDLGSLVLLGCLELKKVLKEKLKDEPQWLEDELRGKVLRVLDTERHNLLRQLRRARQLEFDRAQNLPPDRRLVIDQFRELLTRISPLHVMLFEQRYLEGQPIDQLCSQFKMSRATLYRRLAEIVKTYRDSQRI